MSWSWVFLLLAGCFECAFTTCMKLSEGLTKVGWTAAFLVLSTASLGLLALATAPERISIGTGYAVWTGIGALGTAAIGIIWFKDPATFWRVFFLLTLTGSLVGLKLVSPEK